MFFNKKKPKLDPKVRFQHKQFKTKLDTARTYKRSNKAVSDSGFDKFMNSVGLRSRWSQGLFFVLLGTLFYLAYIPNFLSVQNISISGLSQEQTQLLDAAIRKQIIDSSFFNPQRNLVVLQTETIIAAANTIPTIDYIASIDKHLGSQTLYVNAASKYERFLVATPEKVYDVYNDGSLTREAGLIRTDWSGTLTPSMIKVQLYQEFDFETHRQLFHPDLINYLNRLLEQAYLIEGQQLAYLTFREPEAPEPLNPPEAEEIPIEAEVDEESPAESEEPSDAVEEVVIEAEPLPKLSLPYNSSEVHVVYYKNNDVRRTYKVIFDATADPVKTIEELRFLLAQTAPDRYNRLFYIDMRIPDKAFICLENTACAN